MKFIFREINLWLKNGYIRKLRFEPNKVNIITGDSGTGKSTILDIIDYCLFASKVSIPDEIIGENVEWYGITFDINDKKYTIARGSIGIGGKASKKYYFSGSGETPETIEVNINEESLKSIVENEFSIDYNVKIPYGGKILKPGSKISARYFLLFNTQSGDVIAHTKTYFDKQDSERYREALHRIFDIAVGIENVNNTLIKEKIVELKKELTRLERKQIAYSRENAIFESDVSNLVNKAKEYDLIDDSGTNCKEDITKLRLLINEGWNDKVVIDFTPLNKLNEKRRLLLRKIRNLTKFKSEYQTYKELAAHNYESLKPVEYILSNYDELLDSPDLQEFIYKFEKELIEIKKVIVNKSPLEVNVNGELDELTKQLNYVEMEIDKFPKEKKSFDREIDKYVFVGEMKAKLAIYESSDLEEGTEKRINELIAELGQLEGQAIDKTYQKTLVIKALEETAQFYIDQSHEALDNYKGYQAVFDYENKTLQLRKPKSPIPSVVGSSSNHLFLHLCFFLGLHDYFISNDIPYIPSFLILDQPSRPYFEVAKKVNNFIGDDKINFDNIIGNDRIKLAAAFKILDIFIERVKSELKNDFQIIILEHVPIQFWRDEKLEHVHLVDEFRDGNALIPLKDILK